MDNTENSSSNKQPVRPLWHDWEKAIGGLKVAVILILLFATFMIVGTFVESYQGTEFANRIIYKRLPFMLVQFGMFLSIIYAAYLRLPPKKRLYGFYTIHTGLICLGLGSFITFHSGIDGQITLLPNEPTRQIRLQDNVLRIANAKKGEVVTYRLPYVAFESNLDDEHNSVKLKKFLPFSEPKVEWRSPMNDYSKSDNLHSGKYLLFNDRFSEELILSLHPEAQDFKSTLKLGPLSVHYLPEKLGPCFAKNNPSGLIVWNHSETTCFTPEERNIHIQKTKTGKTFLAVKDGKEVYIFFPEFSPFPTDKDLKNIKDGPYRVFSKKLFEEKPNLFIFGRSAAYYSSEEWELVKLERGTPIALPWMGFQLAIDKHSEALVPTPIPQYITPIQKNNEMIRGAQKAVLIEVNGKDYWVTDQRTLNLKVKGELISFDVVKETMTMPFEFSLKRFKMDKDPGTNSPASYESFVRLFTKDGTDTHHIYMNNPLKHAGFTFYQASYFQTQQGGYGSVLSANVDPGRFLKYLGSLLLVLGALWHYIIRRKKMKTTQPTGANSEVGVLT